MNPFNGFVSVVVFYMFVTRCVFAGLPDGAKGGDGWIQIGVFRVGMVNHNHFSVSSSTQKKTVVIFRNDGTIHPGPRDDWGLWDKPFLDDVPNVRFSANGIEFGPWCLGSSGFKHMSIAHREGKTAMIWRNDGTRHPGPRNDWSCWKPHGGADNNVQYGQDKHGREFYQFNDWFRIGDTGAGHMSIASEKTCVIYRQDGTIHPGPRDDFGWAHQSGPFSNCVNNKHVQSSSSSSSSSSKVDTGKVSEAKKIIKDYFHSLDFMLINGVYRQFERIGDKKERGDKVYFRYELRHLGINENDDDCIKAKKYCWHIVVHVHDQGHKSEDRIYAYEYSNDEAVLGGKVQFGEWPDFDLVSEAHLLPRPTL